MGAKIMVMWGTIIYVRSEYEQLNAEKQKLLRTTVRKEYFQYHRFGGDFRDLAA
jgi:hypothetical protein